MRKKENITELNLTLGLAFRLGECLCRCSQLQMQAMIRMEHTCDGIGFECRWALGGLGSGRDTSPAQYSPVTDTAGRDAACLLALDESRDTSLRRQP